MRPAHAADAEDAEDAETDDVPEMDEDEDAEPNEDEVIYQIDEQTYVQGTLVDEEGFGLYWRIPWDKN